MFREPGEEMVDDEALQQAIIASMEGSAEPSNALVPVSAAPNYGVQGIDPSKPPLRNKYGSWSYWDPNQERYLPPVPKSPEERYFRSSIVDLKTAFGNAYQDPEERAEYEKEHRKYLTSFQNPFVIPRDKPPINTETGFKYWDPIKKTYERGAEDPETHYGQSPDSLSQLFGEDYENPLDRNRDDLLYTIQSGKLPSYDPKSNRWLYWTQTGVKGNPKPPEQFYGVDKDTLDNLFSGKIPYPQIAPPSQPAIEGSPSTEEEQGYYIPEEVSTDPYSDLQAVQEQEDSRAMASMVPMHFQSMLNQGQTPISSFAPQPTESHRNVYQRIMSPFDEKMFAPYYEEEEDE